MATIEYDGQAFTPAAWAPGPVGGSSTTTYYLMLGYDTVVPTAPTVWQVTGTPDTTGASSGNPTINAATIRVISTWEQ